MKTPGYMITCDEKHCVRHEFFETEENWLDADWYPHPDSPDTMHLCTDCWNSQENERDELAKLAFAEDENNWPVLDRISYATEVRRMLNGEG